LLFWKKRLVIPKDQSLIKDILEEFHASPIGGHAGISRTIARIKDEYYWQGMKEDIHHPIFA
jgi:hypothetical protein